MGAAGILRSFLETKEKGVRAIFLLLVPSLLIPTSNSPSAQPDEKVKRAQIIRDTGKPGDYRLLATFDLSEADEETMDIARAITVHVEPSQTANVIAAPWSAAL